MNQKNLHDVYMHMAIEQAKIARDMLEAPIGCIIVKDGQVIGAGHNLRESKQDALMHAEIIAIQNACKSLGSWRLENCDLYVTLEPCVMCAGAILQARIRHVYYGARDPKGGAVESVTHLFDLSLNHKVHATGGVLENACSDLLKKFFRKLREK